MTNLCRLNGLDAWLTWGVTLPQSSVDALWGFAPLKGYVTNESSLIDGVQVLCLDGYVPRVDKRELTLVFYLHAKDRVEFNSRRDSLESELRGGRLTLWVADRPDCLFRLVYKSCSQFTQFNGRLAKFTLRLEEPNPNNRTIPS